MITNGKNGLFEMTKLSIAAAMLFAAVGCGVDGANGADQQATDSVGAESAATPLAPAPFSAEQETALGMVAKIEFANKGVVRFFEPQDGVILISETGYNGSEPMIPSALAKASALEKYEGLTGNKAPAALVAAAERAKLLKQRPSTNITTPAADLAPPSLRAAQATAPDAADGIAQVKSAVKYANSYDQWFYDNFCAGGAKVGSGVWDYVVNWMFVTGTGAFQRNDMNWVDSTVSVYGGNGVHYRVQIMPWYTWSTVLDVMIPNGYYNKWHRDNGTDWDSYIYVDQAAGDSYHWCSYGDNW